MQGWDWAQAIPDRSTGFFGSVVLETSGPLALLDPAVQTLDIQSTLTDCNLVRLRFLVRVEGLCETYTNATSIKMSLDITSDWGETWSFDTFPWEADNIQREVLVKQPEKVGLWWPHGVGVEDAAHLHTFTFSLGLNQKATDAKTINVGIRTIQTYLDTTLQGQRFQINGKDIYLVGGNWITTDQALRYSASVTRYCDEVALHRHAGLNLIRVWG